MKDREALRGADYGVTKVITEDEFWETVKDREALRGADYGVTKVIHD